MNKRVFLTACTSFAAVSFFSSCTTSTPSSPDPVARRKAIDAEVDRALSQLYGQVRGSRELVASSRGTLVFPNVVSAGFIVGGTHGDGALRKAGATSRYYSISGVSAGLLAGAQSRAIFYLFMTEDALKKFEASSGWTAGVDASVALLKIGANAQIDTETAKQPVIGFALTNAGLMANISLDGTRITPLNL